MKYNLETTWKNVIFENWTDTKITSINKTKIKEAQEIKLIDNNSKE